MIRGMDTIEIAGTSGKRLNVNQAAMDNADLLAASNIEILADGVIRTVPGYTLVRAFSPGPVQKIYDFQRAVDHKQFQIVQHGGVLDAIYPDGSVHTLSTGETSEPYSFVQNAFALYGSNGTNSWRFVDTGAGGLTKYQWGITPPATAPAISAGGASSLSLTYGRQYVYCYVSEITDSLGIVRTSVSAPSPISAFSGPTSGHGVSLTSITASADPQVNKVWVFATFDTPADTQSTYYFAAEIANGTISFTDTLANDALDETRTAPFNTNGRPPAASRLVSFGNRLWALTDNFIQYSGGENVLLGIPEECWNPQEFVSVPSGSRTVTGGLVIDNGAVLMVGTPTHWMSVQLDTTNGTTTVNQRDRTVSPGLAGKQAAVQIPGGMLWVGQDKRLWLWRGGSEAGEFSAAISLPVAGTKSTDDLAAQYLSGTEVRYYSFGLRHYLLVAGDTGSGHFDWIALYQLKTSLNQYTGSLSISGAAPTDWFPPDAMTATANVLEAGNAQTVWLGDSAGNVWRWPNFYQFNTAPITATISTAWLHGDLETVQHWLYVDLTVDDLTAFNQAAVSAVALDQPDMAAPLVAVDVKPYPFTHASGQRILRVPLAQVKGASIGKYLRLVITLPADGQPHAIEKISVGYRPAFRGTL